MVLMLSLVMGACGSSDDTADTKPTKSDPTTPDKDKEETVKVTFDLNYTGATDTPSAQTIKKGSKAKVPTPQPTRAKYKLTNWYTDEAATKKFAFTTPINKNITLYAGWQSTIKTVTVTFDLNYTGAPTATTDTVKEGEATTKPTDPTKDGYTFDGWYEKQDGSGTAFAFTTTLIPADITLYARWTPVYTVTFDGNGGTGTAPDPQTIKKGDNATAPTAPTRDGYVFKGWYKNQDGSGTAFAFDTTPITGDTTLYAGGWITIYSITLGDTEYAGVADDATKTILVDIGTVYKKINGQTVQLVVTDNAGTAVANESLTLTNAKATITVTRDGKPYTTLKLFVKPTTKADLTAIVNAAIGGEGDTVNLNFVDTSHITDMSGLFKDKNAFNGNLSEWDTAKVEDMSGMFRNAKAFNQDIGNWKTGKVTNMIWMFNFAVTFNQDIGNWDTTNVTDMHSMFNFAPVFNQAIGNWKTGKVTNMSRMFLGAFKFNQNLSTWDVSKVAEHTQIFAGTAMENKTTQHPKFK